MFDERALQFLVGTMGAERVMLGSDYPFPLGEHRVGSLIRIELICRDRKVQLLGGNALNFSHPDRRLRGAMPREVLSLTAARRSSRSGEQLTYSSYLKVPELLQLQHPQSSPQHHDELLFIIVHQTYELWFQRIAARPGRGGSQPTGAGTNPESRDEVYEAARLLRRCTEITRVLVEQFTILETMLPTHFLAFRGKLEPASGFQSEQFRELEFLCGLKDEKMLRYHKPTPEAHAQLERRLREPSLHDVFFDALHAMGKLQFDDQRDRARTISMRAPGPSFLFTADERSNRDWIDVCERLTEFDELVVSWRLRHIQLVERVIGVRMGTGGSAGSSYLKHTLDKKFFPELWEARTLLTE